MPKCEGCKEEHTGSNLREFYAMLFGEFSERKKADSEIKRGWRCHKCIKSASEKMIDFAIGDKRTKCTTLIMAIASPVD